MNKNDYKTKVLSIINSSSSSSSASTVKTTGKGDYKSKVLQIITNPKVSTPSAKKVTTPTITPVQKAKQTLVEQAKTAVKSTVKKIADFTIKLVTPSIKTPVPLTQTEKGQAKTQKVSSVQPISITPNQKKVSKEQLGIVGQVKKTATTINEKLGYLIDKYAYTPVQYQQEAIETGKKPKLTATKILGGAIEDAIMAYMPVSGIGLKAPQEGVKLTQRLISGVKSGATFAGIQGLISALKDEKIEIKDILVSGGIGAILGFSHPTVMKDISRDAKIGARQTLEEFGFKTKDFKNAEVLKSKFFEVIKKEFPEVQKGTTSKKINASYQKFVEAYNNMTSAGIEPSWKLPDIKEWVKNLWKDADKSTKDKEIIKQKADADFIKLVKSVIEKKPEVKKGISLVEGEKTPQQAIGEVIKSGQENTPEGKELIKSAMEAQKSGQNVLVEKPPVQGGISKWLENYKIEGTNKYRFIRNIENKGGYIGGKPKGIGEAFNQKYEPVGEYMNIVTKEGFNRAPSNLKKGVVELKNPLIIETDWSPDWKKTLSEKYGGLTRNELSQAIKNDGYDGIITMIKEKNGEIHPSEVVNLNNLRTSPSVLQGGVKEGGKIVSPTTKKVSGGEIEKPIVKPKTVEVPKEQLPVGEGKLKVSKLEARMKGVIGKATEKQIEDLGLSTYNEMNKKEQITKASQYVVNNQQEALDVLQGKKEAPKGIIPESIYVAMTELAKDDITLATKLSTLQATALGQRISILSEINKDNPVRLLNEVYKIREEQFKKRYGNKSVKEVSKKVAKTIKDKVKAPDKYDWSKFLDSIEC